MAMNDKMIKDDGRPFTQAEQELIDLKSRFVLMVSHELRTPLTVIRTSTKILEQYSHIATEEKRQEYFRCIYAAINNMTQLLETVLTVNRAEAGELQFNPSWFNVREFCSLIVEEMNLSRGPEILLITPPTHQTVYLDVKLLRLILTNLLSNAIKYSSAEQVVELELFYKDNAIVFELRDHGIGIPKADQPHLFTLFHRGQNAESIQGVGLGLAIAKHCIVLHKGEITFTSQEGVGTTFQVRLPTVCTRAHPLAS